MYIYIYTYTTYIESDMFMGIHMYPPNPPPTDTSSPLTAGRASLLPSKKTGCWMHKDGLNPSQAGAYK